MWATGYILDAWCCNALNVSVRAYEELLDLSRAPENKLQLLMTLNQDTTCKEIILKLIKEGALKVRPIARKCFGAVSTLRFLRYAFGVRNSASPFLELIQQTLFGLSPPI